MGARKLTASIGRGPVSEIAAAGVVLLSAISVGLGYSLRPWKSEIREVRRAIAALPPEQTVLVQGGLYPHAGYETRVRLLTAQDVLSVENANDVILLASRGSAYPLNRHQWRCLWSLPAAAPLRPGLVAIPVTPAAQQCLSPASGAQPREHRRSGRKRLEGVSPNR
jgi:hypothetical protein